MLVRRIVPAQSVDDCGITVTLPNTARPQRSLGSPLLMVSGQTGHSAVGLVLGQGALRQAEGPTRAS